MTDNINTDNYHLYKEIDKNEKSYLYKIDFRTLLSITNHWTYNRPLNENIINKLYENIKINNINWILSAVRENDNDNIYLIDGQHRFEAIKKIINEDNDMKINKFVYVNIYSINNIEEDFNYIKELFIKINSNTPLENINIPYNINDILIKEILKNPILSKGISLNPKTHSAHQPMIHKKTLNEIFSNLNSIIKDIDIQTIINNIKYANNQLSIMSFDKMYYNTNKTEIDKNNWNKAKEIGFFLGLKNCNINYRIVNIIANIKNIESLFK